MGETLPRPGLHLSPQVKLKATVKIQKEGVRHACPSTMVRRTLLIPVTFRGVSSTSRGHGSVGFPISSDWEVHDLLVPTFTLIPAARARDLYDRVDSSYWGTVRSDSYQNGPGKMVGSERRFTTIRFYCFALNERARASLVMKNERFRVTQDKAGNDFAGERMVSASTTHSLVYTNP